MFAWRLTVMVFASFVYFVYDELVKGFIFIIIFQNLNRFIDFRGNYYKFIKCLLFFVCFFFFARIHSENQCACKQFISATIIDQLIYWHMSPNTHFPLVCHRKCINCSFSNWFGGFGARFFIRRFYRNGLIDGTINQLKYNFVFANQSEIINFVWFVEKNWVKLTIYFWPKPLNGWNECWWNFFFLRFSFRWNNRQFRRRNTYKVKRSVKCRQPKNSICKSQTRKKSI